MRPGSAHRLTALQSAAASFVESTRRASESRRHELERIAALLGQTDEAAAERLRASAEVGATEAIRRAEEQAEEVTRVAANRVLAMVAGYAATLAAQTRLENEARAERQGELIGGLARVHAPAARAIQEAIAEADSARLVSAVRQAEEIAAAASAAIRKQTPRA